VSGRDQAALSDRARLLGKARAAFTSVEATRADRVAALRQQVQSGAYRVPYDQLASHLAGRL
jgi:anti-sigma28 factor (negative regulator of flagellin synthesis)